MRRVFSTSRRQGLVAALEEDNQANAEEGGEGSSTSEAVASAADELAALPVEVAEAIAQTIETVADIVEEAEEGATQDEQVEEAAETVEALESIAISLGAAAAAGGLDKHSAHAVGKSLDGMYKRVGMVGKLVKPMPALESFGGTNTRVGATTLALEALEINIKKLWESIIAGIKRAGEWIVNFYSKIVGGSSHLKANAEVLSKKAKATSGEPASKELDNEKLGKALHVGGAVSSSAVIGGLKKLQALAKDKFGKATEDLARVKEILKTAEELAATPEKATEILAASKSFESKEEVTDGLSGGSAFAVRADVEKKSFSAGIEASGDEYKGAKLEVLSVPEVEEILAIVVDLAETLAASEKAAKEISAVLGKISDAAKKAFGNGEGEDGKKIGDAGEFFKKASKVVDAGHTALSSYIVRTCGSALSYASESLKQYAPKKEEAAAAAAA